MQPTDIEVIGDELAIRWSDESESFIRLEAMRRACPCASCAGEVDVMGNLHKGPDTPLQPDSFRLVRYATVGGYGIQPLWADQHGTGIFTFDALKQLAEAPNN
ncbi:MAG: gamma-butyrobetaine hydroxylase-like domain-containing protein [Limisphaerales bacterium]